MKREQLYLFQEYEWEEDYSGVEGDGLCEGEEVYAGELAEYRWEEANRRGENPIFASLLCWDGDLAEPWGAPSSGCPQSGKPRTPSCGTASPSVPWRKEEQ